MCGWHFGVDERDVRGRPADKGWPGRVSGTTNNVESRLAEQSREAFPQQRHVLGDHDAHGIAASMVVLSRTLASLTDPFSATIRSRAPAKICSSAAGSRPAMLSRIHNLPVEPPIVTVMTSGPGAQAGYPRRVRDQAVRGCFDRCGKSARVMSVDDQRQRACLGKSAQAYPEASIGQSRRVDSMGEIAKFFEGDAHRLSRCDVILGLRRHGLARQLQRDLQGDQPLLRTIVQVTFQPLPLGVSGLDDPLPATRRVRQARPGAVPAPLRVQ